MYAVQGVAHDAVFGTIALDDFEQVASLSVTGVLDADGFLAACDGVVELLEYGDEFFDEGCALAVDYCAVLCHHLFVDADDVGVGFLVGTKHGVALVKGFVVSYKCLDVFAVVLGDDYVHEAAALVAASEDEFCVIGRYEDEWQQSDVFGEFPVFFFVSLHVFFLMESHAAGDFFFAAVQVVDALQHHHLFSVSDVLRVYAACCALGEGQKVDGIEHIGLAFTIATEEAVYLRREVEFCGSYVAIVQNCEVF